MSGPLGECVSRCLLECTLITPCRETARCAKGATHVLSSHAPPSLPTHCTSTLLPGFAVAYSEAAFELGPQAMSGLKAPLMASALLTLRMADLTSGGES